MAPSPVHAMLAASIAEIERERFKIHAWSDGYVITDRGERICVFHGPQIGLAARVLRMLTEEAKGTTQ